MVLAHYVIVLAVMLIAMLIILIVTVIRQNKAISTIREHANETRKRIIYVAAALPKTSREGALGYHIYMKDKILTDDGND